MKRGMSFICYHSELFHSNLSNNTTKYDTRKIIESTITVVNNISKITIVTTDTK